MELEEAKHWKPLGIFHHLDCWNKMIGLVENATWNLLRPLNCYCEKFMAT
jgi:hypothetical protein